jgi:hypothetical protein
MDEDNCLFLCMIPAFFIESFTTSAKTKLERKISLYEEAPSGVCAKTENCNQKSPYTDSPYGCLCKNRKL